MRFRRCRRGDDVTRRTENRERSAPAGDGWRSRAIEGAKRRAAGAVSGEAAERPMEPEAVRASPCVFAVPFFPDTAVHSSKTDSKMGKPLRKFRLFARL